MATLMKKAKEVILQQMEECPELDVDTVINLVRPHYLFDAGKAREQAIRRKANQLMAQFRDENGIRKCFIYEDAEGTSKYVNIEITSNKEALDSVETYLQGKYNGLNASIQKIKKRRKEVDGQISIFDEVL